MFSEVFFSRVKPDGLVFLKYSSCRLRASSYQGNMTIVQQVYQWDKEIEDKAKGLDQDWDEQSQTVCLSNRDTCKTSITTLFTTTVSNFPLGLVGLLSSL